ncbi:uncharacterized protein erich1 [Genypterus blacodes]|uniref:uncharacterized protein erich1 n=1 Tax=Genypterus blacodes TaxID=154954 RepID=UPI003F76712A
MAQRKEVFRSKVLHKLYPAAAKVEKEPSPPQVVEKSASQEKNITSCDGGVPANPCRRVYTALLPPADYKPSLERSVTLSLPKNINTAEDAAEDSSHESSEEPEQEKEEELQRRRRRKRKRKLTPSGDLVKDGSGQGQIPSNQGGEPLSRNKKRKLKKKRHKEKLLSMGLVPRAAALEFTYKRDGDEEEEEEEDESRAAEVSDFLRTTMEIYMSDSSLNVGELPTQSEAMENLLDDITGGRRPTSVLKQLHSLKTLVQQKETDKLSKALEELHSASCMSPEETTAVVSLLRYWITHILPMQSDTKPAATHTSTPSPS